MALNLDFKKDPMSPANANSIIEEINDMQRKTGVYKLSNNYDGVAVGDEIELADSINNYDFLMFHCGATTADTYNVSISMPHIRLYSKGIRTRPTWRVGTDIALAVTLDGKIAFNIVSETKLSVKTIIGTCNLRGILGVKLY